MAEIKFLSKFYQLIKNGRKTQTMRMAQKRLDVQEGDIVTAKFQGCNETLQLKIIEIGYKQMKSITLEDAKREGYNTIHELEEELLKIYPIITKFDRLYYYQFEVM